MNRTITRQPAAALRGEATAPKLRDQPSRIGSGVGLAIVAKAVERMGEHVGVESKTGEGSRFRLELPAAVE